MIGGGSRGLASLRACREEGRAGLAAFLPVGFPTFTRSLDALQAVGEHVEVLELGLPHHSPGLDGPDIAMAGAQALRAGFRTGHMFAAVRELAASSTAELITMSYWEPVAEYGVERFACELAEAGGAGVVLPDLPPRAVGAWLRAAEACGLSTVFLVDPAAGDEELRRACAAGSGFVYAPAVAQGPTGQVGDLDAGLPGLVKRLRGLTELPIGVGKGVSDARRAEQAARFADLVIVGSALVRRLQAVPGRAGVRGVASLAEEFAAGVRAGSASMAA